MKTTMVNSELAVQQRPWGNWRMLMESKNLWVKKITVDPKQSISLQKHEHRREVWLVAEGKAVAEVGSRMYEVWTGESIKIPKGSIHRLSNVGDEPLVVIELALGDILTENDIIRIDDQYGRN